MDFRYRLMRFMSGRYGVDSMFYAITAAAVVLSFVNIFVRSLILQIIVYALMIYALFRVFSRNTVARSRENRMFAGFAERIKKRRDFYRQKKNDRFHVYKKCPHCGAILRLPRRPGSHTTACPKCGRSFKVKVRK